MCYSRRAQETNMGLIPITPGVASPAHVLHDKVVTHVYAYSPLCLLRRFATDRLVHMVDTRGLVLPRPRSPSTIAMPFHTGRKVTGHPNVLLVILQVERVYYGLVFLPLSIFSNECC